MKLQDQVTSLEISKKFKELGVRQESLFRWHRFSDCPDGSQDWRIIDFKGSDPLEWASAFTVAELGELLPAVILIKKVEYYPEYINMDSGWYIAYNGENKKTLLAITSSTEANARGKMLIYLLENKLI